MEAQIREAHLLNNTLETAIHCSIGKNAPFLVRENKIVLIPFFSGAPYQKWLCLLITEQPNYRRRQRECTAPVIFGRREIILASFLLFFPILIE